MTDRLVWLPFDPVELGDPPEGLRYEVVDPTEHVPDSVADVRFYVPPYQVGPRVAEVLPRMAEGLGADVVVMGAVSRSRVRELFVGSTAERVLDRVGCDVLVVKPGDFAEQLPF